MIMERNLLSLHRMSPESKKSLPIPAPTKPEDVDFAEEAAPKSSEFGDEKDAKEITAGDFDLIP